MCFSKFEQIELKIFVSLNHRMVMLLPFFYFNCSCCLFIISCRCRASFLLPMPYIFFLYIFDPLGSYVVPGWNCIIYTSVAFHCIFVFYNSFCFEEEN